MLANKATRLGYGCLMPERKPGGMSAYANEIGGDDLLCMCGCGEKAVFGAEAEAITLKACKPLADKMKRLKQLKGKEAREASHLLWMWGRVHPVLDSIVHDKECLTSPLGPPLPVVLTEWRKRAAAL